ncbi:DUF308 domain-containing protein [Chitinophaga pendula]|uniref:DUF308 domain-containing protein n=1 Tax=Chitinophaga TaxID=79328 RepID=UPI000BAF796E|nr:MULTISPECIES: DUF308 domain-containing protein [Chitinophaga]ASZ10248.1 hypothetical protein CK934_04265 [Chitinophaga sp. MD30]UCJ06792.1 DUF308 domain-containing protein [Chitinophaga pendula]
MQSHISTSKVACIVSLIAGILAAVFAFATKTTPHYSVMLGGAAAFVGIISLVLARKSTDDMQLATAGLFMSIVSCIVGLWQLYH